MAASGGVQETTHRTSRRRYASGKHAKAQCPVCGLVHRYVELRQDWRGVWVCRDCWDPKHPQERILSVADAESLDHPQPLLDEEPDNVVELTDEEGFASHLRRVWGRATVMARNYTNFVEDLQEWAENDDAEFVAEIPQIMEMVELDLSRRLRHLDFYKRTEEPQRRTIIGTAEYAKPDGFVTTLSLTATVGVKKVFIHERPQSFLDFYWSDVTAEGSPPKYYASLSETQIRIAPTPNAVWPLTWVHTIRPETLSTTTDELVH